MTVEISGSTRTESVEARTPTESTILTVLGPVPAQEQGAVLLSESLLSILPGAELAPEVVIDRLDIVAVLRRALEDFRSLGGGMIVDLGGLTTGRDVELSAFLSEQTGVQIVHSTGFGPTWSVGSHWTNNVSTTGMTVERIADVFIGEVTDGLMVPPRERIGPAGVISVSADPNGYAFEGQVVRAAARAAAKTGVAIAVRSEDPLASLAVLDEEGVSPDRVLVCGLDRIDRVEAGLPAVVAARGSVVGLDHAGWPEGEGYLDLGRRARLVLDLFEAGHGEQVAVSSSAVGYAVHMPDPVRGDFGTVLRDFVPVLRQAGGSDAHVAALLGTTPLRLLSVKA